MAKRSTNFNPRHPRIGASDLLGVATWLGMTDEEIRAMAERHAERVRQAQPASAADVAEHDAEQIRRLAAGDNSEVF